MIEGSHDTDRELSLSLLDRVLATELVCMFRDWRHLQAGADIYTPRIKQQLAAQADQQALHAEFVARRIVELGGVPDLRTETLPQRSVIDYESTPADPRDIFLPALVEDDLLARQIATDAYVEIIDQLSKKDPWTSRMLLNIVSVERAHADGLADILRSVSSA